MGKRYLLDTNIVIYYLGGVLTQPAKQFTDEVLMRQANLSVISKIELLSWIPSVQADLDNRKDFIASADVITLDNNIVSETISIRKYNKKKVKLPDAIIAATCLTHNFTLISRNKTDFKEIAGLKPYKPFDL